MTNFSAEEIDSQCLVPGMFHELYDCCVSSAAGTTCKVFGSLNAILMAFIVIAWIILLIKNKWFRNNLLMSYVFLFQLLPSMWRTWFYLSGGFEGSDDSFIYIMTKSSDSGDFVVSLTALAMHLYLL